MRKKVKTKLTLSINVVFPQSMEIPSKITLSLRETVSGTFTALRKNIIVVIDSSWVYDFHIFSHEIYDSFKKSLNFRNAVLITALNKTLKFLTLETES